MLANFPNIPCPHCGLKQLRRTWLRAGEPDRAEPRTGNVTICQSCRQVSVIVPNAVRRRILVTQLPVIFPSLQGIVNHATSP